MLGALLMAVSAALMFFGPRVNPSSPVDPQLGHYVGWFAIIVFCVGLVLFALRVSLGLSFEVSL